MWESQAKPSEERPTGIQVAKAIAPNGAHCAGATKPCCNGGVAVRVKMLALNNYRPKSSYKLDNGQQPLEARGRGADKLHRNAKILQAGFPHLTASQAE